MPNKQFFTSINAPYGGPSIGVALHLINRIPVGNPLKKPKGRKSFDP